MTWFAHRPPRREVEALLDYWDDVIDRSPTTPVPPAPVPVALGAVVRTLHTAEIADPGEFAGADQLLRSLLAKQREITPMNATSATVPLSPPRTPPRVAILRLPSIPIRKYAIPAFEIALIILLMLASAAGIWLAGDRHDPHRIIAPEDGTPTVEASPDVPMYRGNPERTGQMPGPGPDGTPVELWRAEVEGSIEAAPAIVDGTLYFGAGDGGVYAFDSKSGEQVWIYHGSSPVQSSPAVHDGIVYIGSEDGTLYALNAADGSEVWTFPGARADAAVAIVGNAVYTGSANGYLYALNAATGAEFWRAPLNEAASRSPAVADGVIYMGSADGVLHTFDALTGEPGWALKLDGDGVIATTVVHQGVVYQNTFDGSVNHAYALDAETGDELWRFDTESGQGFLPPAVGNGLVYLPSTDHSIYAVDAATGALIWRFETGDQVNAAPALVGDTLYAVSNDGFVYALDAATGTELWRFAIAGEPDFGPVVTGGVAYVGTGFGYLYAIGGSGEPLPVTGPIEPGATPAAATPVIATPMASPAASGPLASFVWEVGGEEGLLGQPEDVAIAPDGSIWIVASGVNQLHRFDADGALIERWSDPESYSAPQADLRALAFGDDGTVYIADHGTSRILKLAPDGTLLTAWGSKGSGEGQFLQLNDLVIDRAGNVYAVDTSLRTVQKFAPDGTFLAAIAGPADDAGGLVEPPRFGIDAADNLYVPDDGQIKVFPPDGMFLRSFGVGDLDVPIDAAVDANGNVFVSDAARNEVLVFDPTGALIGSWGSFGGNPGQFRAADVLELDNQGNLYVVDFDNQRIQKFAVTLPPLEPTPTASPTASNSLATFVWQVGQGDEPPTQPEGIAIAPDGALWIVDSKAKQVHQFDADGTLRATWDAEALGLDSLLPASGDGSTYGSIAFDQAGNAYILDSGNYRVLKYGPDMTLLTEWGTKGSGDGQFQVATDLVIDSAGNVYVMDETLNRVQQFTANGDYLATISGPGDGEGQLSDPAALGIDAQDNLYLPDASQIEVFASDGTFLRSFGKGNLGFAVDIVVDAEGRAHVSDAEGNAIQIYDQDGVLIGTWGEFGRDEGQVIGPGCLALDKEGNIYVIDYANGRIQKFALTLPEPEATPVATPAA
jgi:outer membrane protein assembly factor BamB